jgi:valyl-tRNA synthetase
VLSAAGDVEVIVGLKGLVEAARERERVERELKRIDKDGAGLRKRLDNPAFVQNAPAEVVAEARAQLDALERQRVRLADALALADEL